MSSNFPIAKDSFHTVVNNVDDVMGRHINNPGDAIEALEAKVGIDSSAVANSFDYLIKNTTGGHDHNGSNSRILSYFKTGDLLLSSVSTARDNWTNKSSVYSNSFIRISTTPNTTPTGSNSHTHGAGTFSVSVHTHGAGTLSAPNHTHSGTAATTTSGPHGAQSGGGWAAARPHSHSYSSGNPSNTTISGVSASDGSGAISRNSGSGDHIPTYVTAIVWQRD